MQFMYPKIFVYPINFFCFRINNTLFLFRKKWYKLANPPPYILKIYTIRFLITFYHSIPHSSLLITHWLHNRKNFLAVALRTLAPQTIVGKFFPKKCGLLTTIIKASIFDNCFLEKNFPTKVSLDCRKVCSYNGG